MLHPLLRGAAAADEERHELRAQAEVSGGASVACMARPDTAERTRTAAASNIPPATSSRGQPPLRQQHEERPPTNPQACTHLLIEVHACHVGAALLVHRHWRLLRLLALVLAAPVAAAGGCPCSCSRARIPHQLIFRLVAGWSCSLLPLPLLALAGAAAGGQHPVDAAVHLQQLAVQQLGHGRCCWAGSRGQVGTGLSLAAG